MILHARTWVAEGRRLEAQNQPGLHMENLSQNSKQNIKGHFWSRWSLSC